MISNFNHSMPNANRTNTLLKASFSYPETHVTKRTAKGGIDKWHLIWNKSKQGLKTMVYWARAEWPKLWGF